MFMYENKSFMSSNLTRLPKVYTGALGITRSAGANWKSSGAGSRYWGASNDLDSLKDINRAYLQTRLANSPSQFLKQSVDSQPLNKENGVTPGQNPNDLDSLEAAEAFKDCIGGESSNGDSTEQQTVVALEEPFSVGCYQYYGTSFHSAVEQSTRKLFSKLATPGTYGVGRSSGDDLMMLGAFRGTAALDEDITLGTLPPEPSATPVGMDEMK